MALTRLSCFRWSLVLWLAATSIVSASAQSSANSAVAYQINAEHTGSITMSNFVVTPTPLWSVDLGASVSYPLIANNHVYVTTGDNQTEGMKLYALNAATGQVDWSVAFKEFYPTDSAAYDNGRVFVFNNNFTSSTMSAYDASTGDLLWSSPLTGQYLFTSPPTARNGFVYTGGAGSGGTLYALRESDGQMVWRQNVENGDHSSPAVTEEGVYVSYVGPQSYKFDPESGAAQWHFDSGIEGGGGKTPVYYNGKLYVREVFVPNFDNNNILILDADSGAVTGKFESGYFTTPTAPAFYKDMGYYAAKGVLKAFNPDNGDILWSRQLDSGSFVTAPIVINGVVYEGTKSGVLYGLDGITGETLTTVNVGDPIFGPDEGNIFVLTGLGAAAGLLAVPAGDTLHVYQVTVPEPSACLIGLVGGSLGVGLLRWRKRSVNRR